MPSFRFAPLALAALLVSAATPREPADVVTLTLHPEHRFRAIHSSGASDAWSVQFLGRARGASRGARLSRFALRPIDYRP